MTTCWATACRSSGWTTCGAATEDSLLDLADHLPGEAAEALLQLATGGAPDRPAPAVAGTDPFAHPDAQRRFRVMEDVDALERALDYPWRSGRSSCTRPQRQLVEREYSGPARVSGSAGTGKTIVALHRAVHLARAHPESRVLLATFSEEVAAGLRARLKRLTGNEPKVAERLEVDSMNGIGRRLYAANVGRLSSATDEDLRELLGEAAAGVEGHRFGTHFLWTEWSAVVDAWQLASWEDYRDVQRLGRKTRLSEKQGELLWSIFSPVQLALAEKGELDGARHVRAAGGENGGGYVSTVRFLRDRRGPGYRRRGAAVSGVPGRAPAEQLGLRRGSRTADLPDAVLLAGARHRCARANADVRRPTGRRVWSSSTRFMTSLKFWDR